MTLTDGFITLRNVRFHAFHGVLPQERQVGGDFMVTLRVGYPLERAMETDEVTDTLDYAALYALVEREMAVPSKLLEHVAGRIVKAVKASFPEVTSVDIELTKLNPPMGADCEGAAVEVHFSL